MSHYYWNFRAIRLRWKYGGWRGIVREIHYTLPAWAKPVFWFIVRRGYWSQFRR